MCVRTVPRPSGACRVNHGRRTGVTMNGNQSSADSPRRLASKRTWNKTNEDVNI